MSHAGFAWHGGRIAEARAAFGDSPAPWIDLSTGINPIPWPGAGAIAPDWQRLPDPKALADLEATAARYFGVDPALCCAVPGSEIALRLLGRSIDLPGLYRTPAYRTHAEVCDGMQGIAEFTSAYAGPKLMLLANPNNPNGCITGYSRLGEWLDWQEQAGGWLAVDEAFADTVPEISMASHVDDHRRLIVLRSFGKFFGLAGVRLGFVLAPRRIITAFRKMLGEWPLSAAALEIGNAAYADTQWIAATRKVLPTHAARLDRLLRAHGLEPKGDCPLFRLVETPHAHALFERLARHAILTRPFTDHARWLRFGLAADDGELARLDRALSDG